MPSPSDEPALAAIVWIVGTLGSACAGSAAPPDRELAQRTYRAVGSDEAASVRRSFLESNLASGVELGDALLYRLAALGAEGRVAVEGWRVARAGASGPYRLTLVWASDAGDPGDDGRRRAAFGFEPGGRVRARTPSAESLLASARGLASEDRAPVLPTSFVPDAGKGEPSWTGRNRKVCRAPVFDEGCRTMEAFFGREELIEAVGWFVAGVAGGTESVGILRQRGDCSWYVTGRVPEDHPDAGWAAYRVTYRAPGDTSMSWSFDASSGRIEPTGEDSRFLLAVAALGATETEGERVERSFEDVRRVIRRAAESGGERSGSAR